MMKNARQTLLHQSFVFQGANWRSLSQGLRHIFLSKKLLLSRRGLVAILG
jgi:hypothetical protein